MLTTFTTASLRSRELSAMGGGTKATQSILLGKAVRVEHMVAFPREHETHDPPRVLWSWHVGPQTLLQTSQGQSCHPSSQRFSPESQSWMAGPSLKQELRFESPLFWRDLRRVFTLPVRLGL